MVDKILYLLKDVFLNLVFIGAATLVTGVVGMSIGLFYAFISTIVFMMLFVIIAYIKKYRARPFDKRCPDEENAKKDLKEIIKTANSELIIITKAGTTIFFLFDDYINLIKRSNVTIKVSLIDPLHDNTVNLIDSTIIKEEITSSKWDKLIHDILNEIKILNETKRINDNDCHYLFGLLKNIKSYKQLIIASHYMWLLAIELANEKLNMEGNRVKLVSEEILKISYYKGIPDIKAWVSDGKIGAFGNYNFFNLGITNPIDIYKDKNNQHFINFLKQCNYILEEAKTQTHDKQVIRNLSKTSQ
jgi:hypothetical protein